MHPHRVAGASLLHKLANVVLWCVEEVLHNADVVSSSAQQCWSHRVLKFGNSPSVLCILVFSNDDFPCVCGSPYKTQKTLKNVRETH